MGVLRHLVLTALIAGTLAGLVASAVQAVRLVPLIYAAEVYENGGHSHDDAAAAPHMPAPATDLGRSALTVVANVIVGVGFAMLLAAAFALLGRRVDARTGMYWGAAGFAAFALAPAMGLPPELPGMAAAELGARQLWWLSTVAATLAGLAALAFTRRWTTRAAGVALMALPQIIGAPHGGGASAVPAELAAQFVAASLASAAIFWIVLGASAGYVYRRLAITD
jgi:cobalt transporter subunit CbtA